MNKNDEFVFVSVLSSPESFSSLQKRLADKKFQLEDLSGHIIDTSAENFDLPEADHLAVGAIWPWHNHELVVRRIA